MIFPEKDKQQLATQKLNYQKQLEKQISENQTIRQSRKRTPKSEYFPFGKPGGGAPYRDSSGNIVAIRPPKFNQNDPKFLNPSNFYQQYGVQLNSSKVSKSPPPRYSSRPQQIQSQTFQPQQQTAQSMNPMFVNPYMINPYMSNYMPMMTQPNYQTTMPSNFQSQNYINPPIPNSAQAFYDQPSSLANQKTFQMQTTSIEDLQRLNQQKKRMELGRALQEQIEERKRKREQEKREKILEEQLQEERLERQRREIEEEVRREAQKKQKQIQDLQNFNANMMDQKVRQKTPIDLAPPAPPTKPPTQTYREIPQYLAPPMNSNYLQINQPPHLLYSQSPQIIKNRTHIQQISPQMQYQLTKLRNDVFINQKQINHTLKLLQNQTRLANQRRFQTQVELDTLKQEMKKRDYREQVRQEKIYKAFIQNQKETSIPLTEKLNIKVKPRALGVSHSVKLADRPLKSKSRFFPLVRPDPIFLQQVNTKSETALQKRKLFTIASLFPDYPDTYPKAPKYKTQSLSSQRLKALKSFEDKPFNTYNLEKYLRKFAYPPMTSKTESIEQQLMGVDCSCCKGSNITDKEFPYTSNNETRVQLNLDRKQQGTESDQPILHPQSQIYLQSLARGFIIRQSLVPQLKKFRKHYRQKEESKQKKTDLQIATEYFSKDILKQAQKVFGKLDLKQSLQDGVKVKAKPAVKIEDGIIYQGEWDQNGFRHGKGTEIQPDGSRYKGFYKENFMQGLGLLIKGDGSMYQGNFKKGKPHGQGKLQDASGITFEGNFRNGKQYGQGKEVYLDGSVYKGDFKQGKKEGMGKITWEDGTFYQGEFRQNLFYGRGRYQYADGKTYDGDWVESYMHGTGKFTWPKGKQYVGGFVNNLREGTGKLTYQNGNVYSGEWMKGKEHGRGEWTKQTKSGKTKITSGTWKNGYLVQKD